MVVSYRLLRPLSVTCLTALLFALVGVSADTSKPQSGTLRLSPEQAQLTQEPAGREKELLPDHWRKVNSTVRHTLARMSHQGVSLQADVRTDMSVYGDDFFKVRADGAMRLTLHVNALGAAERERLNQLGYDITFASDEHLFLEGWLPFSSVEAVSRLDFVTAVRPTLPPVSHGGSVISQGDAILLADRARRDFGVSGNGVTVGVISDSVDGLAQAQASGDLPAGLQVLKAGTGTGEGTAMLEIVNDLAPGARLAFYGPSSSGDMINGINQLAASGARVIVDDLTFFDQPHFQEGPLAQAVNAVAARGVVYATSSGNFAQGNNTDRSHYESDFVGGGSLGGPTRNVHNFGGSLTQRITVLPRARAGIFLQWANPFGAAADDYDLYVVDGDGNIVARGDDEQNGDDLPFEAVFVENPGAAPATFSVIIDLFSGSPRPFELYYSRTGSVQFAQAAGSIAGHANAAGAITVGAIDAADPGNDTIEPFSSQGPCLIFFPAFEARQKPEVAGIDGVAVTGAAGFPSPFFGTSAAAPHVAAIAALMLEAQPALTPSQVKDVLQRTAIDFGPAGIDSIFGAGRVNALEAVRAVRGGGGSGGGSAPQLGALTSRLDGDVLTLTGTASDADGDLRQVQVNLLDGAGRVVAQTNPFDVSFGAATVSSFTVRVMNLSQFPAALRASLTVIDSRGNRSGAALTDFSQADPGGPSLSAASFSGSRLNLRGQTLNGQIAVEINGLIVAEGVNGSSRKVRVNGSPASLNLRGGLNRVRVRRGGLWSNIVLLNF